VSEIKGKPCIVVVLKILKYNMVTQYKTLTRILACMPYGVFIEIWKNLGIHRVPPK
jgi:hypothetical protein